MRTVTLNLGEPKINDASTLYNRYDEIKTELNDYKDLVNNFFVCEL